MGEMKVYCLDDCDFVATRGSVEDLIKWYSDGITDISEEEIREVGLSREGMWVELTSSQGIDKEACLPLNSQLPKEFGDVRVGFEGCYFLYRSFLAELLLLDEEKLPEIIASVEV